MDEKDAPERTLSDVGLRPTSQPAQREPLAADVWFPNGTRNTSGHWFIPRDSRRETAHFQVGGLGNAALCDGRILAIGPVLHGPVYSLTEICGNCRRRLKRWHAVETAEAKAVSP